MLSFVSPLLFNSFTTAEKIASNPYFVIPSEIRPITPSVAIPPMIPPGPRAAKAAVIAAPPPQTVRKR